MPRLPVQKVRDWLRLLIAEEGMDLAVLNFIFCSDDHLHQVNLEYLRHDTFTDIITFDNSEEDRLIEGDIFISTDRVRENAAGLKVSFREELLRVMAHGVLHLCGYRDKQPGEVALMRKKEQAALDLAAKYIA